MSKLVDLMKTAMSNGIKSPKLRLGSYKFSKAVAKQVIWVTDQRPYGENTYYGFIKIDEDAFYPARTTAKEIVQEIQSIIDNPGLAAKVYGQKTGTCCCCGRTLVNKESIRLMIGPICLEKYGFIPSELIDDAEDDGQIKLSDI